VYTIKRENNLSNLSDLGIILFVAYMGGMINHYLCCTDGVMYWGDANLTKIETASINGASRRTILNETAAHYFAFALHDGDIYFTDWRYAYVFLAVV